MNHLPPYLQELEQEAIFIIREAAAFEKTVLLYSIGKDSSVLLHLCQKAFFPNRIPFPALHIDTGYKFPEMYDFRDQITKEYNLNTLVFKSKKGASPEIEGRDLCCQILKTKALLDSLKSHQIQCAIGGARRDEEKSRAKERFFSQRDKYGQWNPRAQRPEFQSLFNTELNTDESMRAFPLSNWTEKDIWRYIQFENIKLVNLYFAQEREVIIQNNIILPTKYIKKEDIAGHQVQKISCRFRSLGCTPCTGAIQSKATTVAEIIEELEFNSFSERQSRAIDKTSKTAMENKKKEGYF